ncbi:MAG: M48 family metallopeptidase, partial [Spirochaetota bacterium]
MYSQIEKNKTASYFLVFLFVLVVVLFSLVMSYGFTRNLYSSVFFGIVAFLISFLSSILTYFFGDSLVLNMTGAVDVSDNPDYRELNEMVDTLAIKAGIPKPKVHILPERALNAFATGRDPNHSHVALTQGLLQKMNPQELEAVIAHELSHIKNYDIRLMLIVSVLAGVLTTVADLFLDNLFFSSGDDDKEKGQANIIMLIIAIIFALLAPIIALIIQMAISRRREFLADSSAVEITRYPEGMISALKKLASDNTPVQNATEGNAHMFIDFPLKNAGGFIHKLFSTHPPIEE